MTTDTEVRDAATPVAIVGIGCLFPKADGLGGYWANVKHGVDCITPVPPTHWDPADYFDPDPKKPDMTYARRGGFLSPVDFNPLEFGIAPRDIEATDTSQLLGLVAAKQALIDAGIVFADEKSGSGSRVPSSEGLTRTPDPGTRNPISRDRVSVILGVTGTLELVIPLGARLGHPKWRRAMKEAGVPDDAAEDAIQRIADSYVPWQENSFPGLLGNVVAGRIANRLDLGGTNCVVDAACASSLSAVHLAVLELAAGRSDVVVTGGVDTFNDIFMYMCFSKTPALSPTGDAKPFDADGDGTILGEGLGIVVLKRLADAELDGDRVYAVIKAIGSSSDGKGTAIYAPSAAGQKKALRTAYRLAGVTPDTIELVEAHGTGTKVGDATEAAALTEVFNGDLRLVNGDLGSANHRSPITNHQSTKARPWCALGSVKSQIGHTKAAAGAASLIKAALALHYKVLPPTLKVTRPVEPLRAADSPFYVNTRMRPWLPRAEHPRRAALSAFGFGGSNFHAVLEEYRPEKRDVDWDGSVELFAVCGETPPAVAAELEKVPAEWKAFARAAEQSRAALRPDAPCRLVLVAHRDQTDLPKLIASARAKLTADRSAAAWSTPDGAYYGSGPAPGKLAVLFPGQGSQAVGMLRDLACLFPEVLASLAAADEAVAAQRGDESDAARLSDLIYPPAAFDADAKKRQDAALRATDAAQPALGAVSFGAWRVLAERFGLEADAFAGHSYGELPALAAAGRLSPADLFALSCLRGKVMARQRAGDPGAMLAAFAPLPDVEAAVAADGLNLVVANRNAPAQAVLSGPTPDIERAEKALTARGVRTARLPVAAAFHSPLVADAAAPFRAALDGVEFGPGLKPVFANSTAAEYPADPAAARDLLGHQLAHPVRFADQVRAMAASGVRTFVEVGPGSVLTRLAEQTLSDASIPGAEAVALDASSGKRPGVLDLGHLLGRLAARGYAVRLAAWEAGSRCRPAADARPGLTVPVCGANAVSPRPKRAPRPPAADGAAPRPAPADRPPPPATAVTPMPDPAHGPPPSGLTQALQLTQQTLAALQQLQEQTARLHKQFLDSQDQAQRTLSALIAQQQALLFPGTAPAAAPAPAPASIPAPAPTPTVTPSPAVRPVPAAEPAAPGTRVVAVAAERPAPSANGSTAQAVERVLLDVVAEKTGYPAGMLELGMALDADLGVDSIKRVEILSALQERLPHAPAVRPEHLGTLHTLRDVADFLAGGPVGAAAPPATDPMPVTPMPAAATEPGDAVALPGIDEVRDILLAVVAEKTGYPAGMLELGMALDADLGVDSIKRVEILSALQERLPHAPAVRPEHLGTLHTLRDVADFLAGSPRTAKVEVAAVLTPPAAAAPAPRELSPAPTTQRMPVVERPAPPPEPEAVVSELLAPDLSAGSDPGRTRRLAGPPAAPATPTEAVRQPVPPINLDRVDRSILQAVDLDLATSRLRVSLPEGAELWLVAPADDPLADALAARLAEARFRVARLPWTDPGSANPAGEPAGLVLLAPARTDPGLPLNRLAFRWLQHAAPGLRVAVRHGGALLASVARLDGAFGLAELDPAADPTPGGLAGLVKTAKHEWPEVACKALDVAAGFAAADPAAAAAALAEELLLNGPVEVGVSAAGRCTLGLARTVRRQQAAGPVLGAKDVVLVTGGARGVTAEVAVALAEVYQPTLILTGRTPPPAGPEPEWLRGLTDEAAMKQAIADHLGAGASPRAVGEFYARTKAQREIARTLARIAEAGARAAYYAVNAANARQAADVLRQAQEQLGPVTALIHGAGVLADRRIEDLTAEQFDAVYSTKVDGLRNLLDLLAGQELKAVVLFSSTTARLGRVGQLAYACANEVLNKTAQVEARRRPAARVVAINWGPWDGGMVNTDLRKRFESEGIGLIPMTEGGLFAVQELTAAGKAVEVVALGKPARSGKSAPPAAGTGPARALGTPPPPAAPAPELAPAFERTLDVDTHPVLRSHVLDGRAVLPMALHMEFLAHAALHGNPGLMFHGFNELRITHGVMVEADSAVALRALAGRAARRDGLFLVPVELRGKRRDGRDVVHSRAEVVLAASLPRPPAADPPPRTQPYPHPMDEVYRYFLFHGPDLHGIERVDGLSEVAFVGAARPAPPPAEWFRSPLRSGWVADPLVLDASFQMMILWSFAQHGAGSLPCFAGRYRQYRRSFPAGPVRVVVRVTRDNGSFARADIDYLDADGQVVAQVQDYECVIDRQLDQAFRKNQLAPRLAGPERSSLMPAADRVAIVGVAVRFPGAGADLARFWADVAAAADRSREVPPGRWGLPPAACLDPRGPHPDSVYCTRGYFLDPFAPDPDGWNVPRNLLAGLDPLFHLVLDVGHRAWRSANTAGIDRRRAGVVLGNICLPTPGASELAREYLGGKVADALGLPREARRVHPLNRYVAGLPAGLLAKSLGLGGGTYTLDAACASSLYAIKLACDELLADRADLMLAGGANGADSQYTQMGFCQLRALSPSGRCSPFDATADGLMVGEGAGVFVLKRLSDALRDRDAVHAVIAGAGLSNDMRGNLLAPDKEGQLRAMRAAYTRAGWRPADVDLIECHATGTPVGDAVEFDSLRELWGGDGWVPGQCTIGSVKSTVGHLLTGAGAAAVAKVLLAFANKVRPPQANFRAPGPGLKYDGGPFRVLREAEPWENPRPGEPRRAAVSGFGFGGVNAHLLLEEFVGQTLLLTPSPRKAVATGVGLSEPPPEPVAVVGMATHFGPWDDLRKFQEHVLGGGEQPAPAPKRNGWGHADRDCPPGYYVERLTVPLDRFRIPPKELEEMLPQQLLMLQTAAAALDDAGAGRPVAGGDPRTGVFVGLGLDLNTTNFHLRWAAKSLASGRRPSAEVGAHTRPTNVGRSPDEWLDSVGPPLTADRTMGALGSIAASRIARAFQFGGPSFTVCSEETSAGRALELAVRALRAGELDRAVVGGVDLAGDPRALLAQGRPVSESGTANPLGAGDGALPGEGAAALVLKRLTDAERDGDRVYAVIRGVGSASGGPPGGVAPDAATYASSLVRACADAVVDPATVEYLEAAATGAAADDGPEAGALAALLSAWPRPAPLAVGAVRGQVGQAGAASAAAGLVKACLALHHQVRPPTVDGDGVRGELAAVSDRCHWSREPRFWLADEGAPRRAVVAATGVDGSAVHVVLEEFVGRVVPDADPGSVGNISTYDPQPLGARPEAVFAVEADGLDGLLDGLVSLADFAVRRIDRPVEWLAREWLKQTPQQPDRARAVTFVARSPEELLEQVEFARESLQARPDAPIPDPAAPDPRPALRDRVFYAPDPLGPAGKVAFVFPGSGNHFPGMGRDLSANWPAVLRRQQVENRRLRSQYSPDRFWADAIPVDTNARQFLFGQVALGTLTADLLDSLGVRADAMIGQSLGESAGLFGLRVWTGRDEMLRRLDESTLFGPDLGPPFDAARRAFGLPPGTPVDWVSGVLAAPAEQVRAALRPGARAYLLIVTTPAECVVGGVRGDVEELVRRVAAPFFPLSGVTLAHCEAGRPVEGPYRELHTLPTAPRPGLTVYSGAWGKPYDPTPASCAESITAGLVGPIDFPAVVEAAYRDGVRFFIEPGPGNSATRMVGATLAGRPHLARAVCVPRQDGVSLVLRLVADLVAERGPADLSKLYGGETRCAALRDPAPPPRQAVTVPVGLPPRELPPLPRPADHPAELEAVSVATAAYALAAPPAPEPEPFDGGLIGVAVEPAAARLAAPWAAGLTPFVAAAVETQAAAAAAHEAFLRVQAGFTRAAAEAVQVHNELVRRLLGYEDDLLPPSPLRGEGAGVRGEAEDRGVEPPGSLEPPRSLDTAQCFAFARGRVGDVLGPLYAEADTFPTRVRLPDGPLMLVDRILAIEGEPRSMTAGRVVTEHHVHAGRWYLDAGRIPTCVAVEAGQADLFLSGFLGIDFQTRGLAVYRLLDAVVTFHRGLPRVGDTIRYDIHIDRFFRQSDTWLFRFRFEATVDGEPLLSMTNGVAGFFTAEALAAGQGIVHTKLDKQSMPGKKPADWRELVPMAPCELSEEQVNALRRGDLVAAFGPDFARANLKNPLKLPGGMLRLLDRVTRLDTAGGRYGLGLIRAEYDVHPDDWFLTCHFVDDMVMPGTLMYECCLHTLRVLLMRLGWVGEDGEVACEPVPGVGSRLKCRGQVIATTKTVAYEVSVKELGYGPEPYCVADALMSADGKPIVEITDMTLRMTGLTREKLETIWGGTPPSPAVTTAGLAAPQYDCKPALYDSARILAFSNGDPSEAFGEPYRVFDRDRVIARLPGPPFQFLDRITAVSGEPFVLQAGAACEAQYDVPPDAWYFAANRAPRMPFSVLLEVALQPCGWLAAYCGSALTSDTDLKFRNLGGKATQFLPVAPDIGTLTVNARMTNVSKSAGMIIQHYDMKVSSRRGTVYEGTTYFGFFSAEALANQVGIAGAKVPELTGPAESGLLPADPPFPAPVLRMVDRIGYQPAGGRAGLGLVRGSIAVDPTFWFFQAHFYQDPVWPGSLGIESFLQLAKYAAWRRWGDPGPAGWQTAALGRPHEWVYRGQVVPTAKEVTVTLEVTEADDARRRLVADGFLAVDGRVIYRMSEFGLE